MTTAAIKRRLDRLDGGSTTRLQALTDDELHDLIEVARKAVGGDTKALAMINGEHFQWLRNLQRGFQR